MPKQPLVSVVVPVYNVEQFIPKCLDSILGQTYRDIEVIVVNDGSKGNINEIVAEYQKKHDNIKLLDMGENRGLFRARLEGFKATTGDYVLSVDGDDSISVDYVRTIVAKAEQNDPDIIMAETVIEKSDEKFIFNLANDLPFESLSGDECLKKFFEQQGENYMWHTVHSKMYSRSIIDAAMPFLDTVKEHIVMCEDVLFNIVFWSSAKRIDRARTAHYYYSYSNQNSATQRIDVATTKKKINDINIVNDKVLAFLEQHEEIGKKFSKDFLAWMNLYSCMHRGTINNLSCDAKTKEGLSKSITFGDAQWVKKTPASQFYKVTTPFDDRLERLKNQIIDKQTQCVSFDIFDTLIVRPFLRPSDLFYLLEDDFKKLDKQFRLESFRNIRVKSEELARAQKNTKEDVSLEQIYQVMQSEYAVSNSVAQQMLAKELDHEIKYCTQRVSAKELYDLVVYMGKKIIITSDMYLPKKVIETILHNAGYDGYDKLYVSSHIGTTKATQNLYSHVTSELSISPKSMLHIGDNHDSDVVAAKNVDWRAVHFPKATEAQHIFDRVFEQSASHALSHLGITVGYGVAMNNYFDNPFKSFNQASNYNCSPYFMGYLALGLAMLGFTKWMAEDIEGSDIQSVVFLSRDGYLPMQVFDIFKQKLGLKAKSQYLPTSRKATIPLSIFGKASIAEIKTFNYKGTINNSVLSSLNSVMAEGADSAIENIDYNKVKQLQTAFVNTYKGYFQGKTAVVDVGYSGKPECIFNELFNVPIETYFMYSGDDNAKRRLGKSVHIYSRLDTASIREKIISELTPSCVGYGITGNVVEPMFGRNDVSYYDKYVISEIQRGAVDFVQNYLELFGDHFYNLELGQNAFAMQALDQLIKLPSLTDRELFRGLLHEDDIAGDKSSDVFDMHYTHLDRIESENARLGAENHELKLQLARFMGVKRSAKLLAGNVKRRVLKGIDK